MVETLRKNAKNPEAAESATIGPTPVANFYEPTVALSFTFASFSAYSSYRNEAFDKLVAEAMTSFDPEKRGALVRSAMRIFHDDVVNIPIWNSIAVYAMRKNIDFTPIPHTLMMMQVKDVSVH
jgi:ABC-type transport system substrate-binding protein